MEIFRLLPGEAARQARERREEITEIRIRTNHPVQLVFGREDGFYGPALSHAQVRKMALEMMEYSYHTREAELSEGYFTMRDGCRVGVCGTYAFTEGGGVRMRVISSMCVRIAREIRGCGVPVAERLLREGMANILITSRPGFGKTTLLRDVARLLSENGISVGIADERHEIAACVDGIPSFDVGPRTDIADGCPKCKAMIRMIRSMSPHVIVTDEIGDEGDIAAVMEATKRGVFVLTSVHAATRDGLETGPVGELVRQGVFSHIYILDKQPGRIEEVWSTGKGEICIDSATRPGRDPDCGLYADRNEFCRRAGKQAQDA
ncbi:MAG: ATPase, T2SS/T4P/T4SS family [Christensenellales bacterium]|nr:ATPase, T2SS/T4P/T4SS family [Christensenellales bacterium]